MAYAWLDDCMQGHTAHSTRCWGAKELTPHHAMYEVVGFLPAGQPGELAPTPLLRLPMAVVDSR